MKYLFTVTKLVMAESIEEALKAEKEIKPLAIYLDDDWKKNNLTNSDFFKKEDL